MKFLMEEINTPKKNFRLRRHVMSFNTFKTAFRVMRKVHLDMKKMLPVTVRNDPQVRKIFILVGDKKSRDELKPLHNTKNNSTQGGVR